MIALRIFCLFLLLSQTGTVKGQEKAEKNFLFELLAGKDPKVDEVIQQAAKYHFQLILSVVKDGHNSKQLTHFELNKDSFYFYPASLIKFPLAIVAAEKMSALKATAGVTIEDSMALGPCSCDYSTARYLKSTRPSSFKQILRELLILSNNDAYNLMFDLIGKDSFNTRIRELGFHRTNMLNRFYSPCSESQQSMSGAIEFYSDSSLIYQVPCTNSNQLWVNDSTWPHEAGIKHKKDGQWKNGPKNYLGSNYVALSDAHKLMIKLILGDTTTGARAIQIENSIKNALINALGAFPRELVSSNYKTSTYSDHYYKFFVDPSRMNTKEGGMRIYNKVGLASGFISDVSYFSDEQNGVHFFLSGAMLAKKDGVMDNGKYDYYDIGIPVFRKIGGIIYQYLLSKKKGD